MISWCALVLFLVCHLMPANTQSVRLERVTREVVVARQADGGWLMTEGEKSLGTYYMEGPKIRCVPPPEEQAKGAEEFTVNIGTLLDLDADIDWATVNRIGTLSDDAGTPVQILREEGKVLFSQRSGPLQEGVTMLPPAGEPQE